jgi:transcriptional regulator NrdR family protein
MHFSLQIDEAVVIIKSINDEPNFGEEDLLEVLKDTSILTKRMVNEEQFFELVKSIKRKHNKDNEEDTLLAYVAMGGQEDKEGFVDA